MIAEKRRFSLVSLLAGVSIVLSVFLIHTSNVSAKEYPDVGGPPAPTGLTISDIEDQSLQVKWDAVAGTKYKIYYSKSGIFEDDSTPSISAIGYYSGRTQIFMSNFSPGTTYFFKIAAANFLDWEGPNSDYVVAITKREPKTPLYLTAKATTTGSSFVDLSWDSANYFYLGDNLEIYRSTDGVNFTLLTKLTKDSVTYNRYTDSTILPNTKYYYKVVFVRASGRRSADSNIASITSGGLALPAFRLVGTPLSDSEIQLSWNSAGGNPQSYNIYRNDNLVFPNYQKIANVPSGLFVYSYKDSGLKAGTQYSYYVAPFRFDTGEGGWSNIAYVSTRTSTGFMGILPSTFFSTLSSTPTISLSGTAVSSTMIDLNWNKLDDVDAAYNIYRSDNPVFPNYRRVASVDRLLNSYQDTGLMPNMQYSYYVIPYRLSSGEGEQSNTTYVRTLSPSYASFGTSESMGVSTAPQSSEESSLSSAVEFIQRINNPVRVGTTANFTYGYKNFSGRGQYIRIVREMLDSNGKVVARVSAVRNVAAGKDFVIYARQVLGRNLSEGAYSIRVRIVDVSTGKVLDENSFQFQVSRVLSYKKSLRATSFAILD